MQIIFALEADGVYWHQYGKRKLEPQNKIDLAAKKGIQLLHVWDFQLREDSGNILKTLIYHLNGGKMEPGIYEVPTGIASLLGSIIEKDKPFIDKHGDLYFQNLGHCKIEVTN